MIYLLAQILLALVLATCLGGALGWLLHRYLQDNGTEKHKKNAQRLQQQLSQMKSEVAMLTDDYDDLQRRSNDELAELRKANMQIPHLQTNLEKSQLMVRQLLIKHESELRDFKSQNVELSERLKNVDQREQALSRRQADLDSAQRDRRVRNRVNPLRSSAKRLNHPKPRFTENLPTEKYPSSGSESLANTPNRASIRSHDNGDSKQATESSGSRTFGQSATHGKGARLTAPQEKHSLSHLSQQEPAQPENSVPDRASAQHTPQASPVKKPFNRRFTKQTQSATNEESSDNTHVADSANSEKSRIIDKGVISNTRNSHSWASAPISTSSVKSGITRPAGHTETEAQENFSPDAKMKYPSAHLSEQLPDGKPVDDDLDDLQAVVDDDIKDLTIFDIDSRDLEGLDFDETVIEEGDVDEAGINAMELDDISFNSQKSDATSALAKQSTNASNSSKQPHQQNTSHANLVGQMPMAGGSSVIYLNADAADSYASAGSAQNDSLAAPFSDEDDDMMMGDFPDMMISDPFDHVIEVDDDLQRELDSDSSQGDLTLFEPVSQQDDLQQIFGIGPLTEKALNNLGITSYAQLAELKHDEIEAIANALDIVPGRIERDDWVGNARRQLEEVLEEL